MKTRLTVDTAGRIVLPQPVRRRFLLTPGATLDLRVEPDAIVLRPTVQGATLRNDNGLLVHQGEPTQSILEIVAETRDQRDRAVSGALK